MSTPETINVLNRLLSIHQCSFPMYLTDAPPWTSAALGPASEEKVVETFELIVADQQAMSQRISAMILEAGGQPAFSDFPMEFTDMHDLSVEFITRRAIGYQSQDIAAIQLRFDALRLKPAPGALAEESLGMAKGHLEALEESANQPA